MVVFKLAAQVRYFTLHAGLREDGACPERPRHTLNRTISNVFFWFKCLSDGSLNCTRETVSSWGMSSLHRDTSHILRAIIEGLDGVSDVKEFQVVMHKDCEKERGHGAGGKLIVINLYLSQIIR